MVHYQISNKSMIKKEKQTNKHHANHLKNISEMNDTS